MAAVTVGDVMEWMEALAPRALAEEWDHPGLQVGRGDTPLLGVLVCLDCRDAVIEEASSLGANLIVSHHPLLFRPLRSLDFEDPVGRRVGELVRRGIALFSAHTNYDSARGGLNDWLAARFGLTGVRPLRTAAETLYKLAVFVPTGHEDAVRDALAGAGAGHIGNYSHCTFQSPGTGTFLPLDGANPYLGARGRLERAEEVRLETIVPASRLRAAVAAMLAAHPYEEVAYDVYRLANGDPAALGAAAASRVGIGRVGDLAATMSVAEVAAAARERLGVRNVRVVGDPGRQVRRLAVCGGSGGKFVRAAVAAGADALLTGDVDHHDALDALDLGLAVIDAGHWGTERAAMAAVVDRLNERLAAAGSAVRARLAQSEPDPFVLFGNS